MAESTILIESKPRGISEFWRKNTSHIPTTELANLLKALRKVGGHIGPNVGQIMWEGMSTTQSGIISLNPEYILEEYPVPAENVDYLVGVVTHEALHKTQWSDLVWRGVHQVSQNMKPRQRIILQKIVYIGEDIYVDYISEQSILGLYTRKTRRVAMDEAKSRLNLNAVTVDELIYLWWLNAWGEEMDATRVQLYEEPLKVLNNLLPELKEVSHSKKGVIDRCDLRRAIYLRAWEGVRDMIASWAITDKALLWYPPSTGQQDSSSQKKAPKSAPVALAPSVAQEIEALLAISSADITPIIRSIVGEENEDVVSMSKWDFAIPGQGTAETQMVNRLKAIFRNYAERKFLVSRGLTSGKVDRKRLYRAPITGRCFMDKQKLPNLNWNICLLIDASGSMGQQAKWKLVENTVATLHKALKGLEGRVQVWAYFESGHICMMSPLIKGKQLFTVPPGGQTASGQALIAAAFFMPKESGRRFLVHITDGASNYGCDVQYGIDYCKAQNIHLVTLGCGCPNRKAMLEQYGRSIQFVDHFSQLPDALEKLLKWTFIYGMKQQPGVTKGLSRFMDMASKT
ncbi:MAG: VWA domain-containing protein [Dehalococcoidia bacterium]|nr:VWA domain-containing protein [Dehalococcoidia bacterium]